MRGKFVNQLRYRQVLYTTYTAGNVGPVCYCDQVDVVPPGKYHFFPYAAFEIDNKGAMFAIFLCREDQRSTVPTGLMSIPNYNNGLATYFQPFGRNFRGVQILQTEQVIAPAAAVPLGIARGIYVPYGFFLRACELVPNAYNIGDGQVCGRFEYMYAEISACEDVE